jgi:hypothetical protein
MARLQFRSATQSKGFAPIQLSKASLSEMEKRDAKLLKALESKHAAEIKQRETNLQAMRENAAYTERANAQNRQIELDNLQREQTSLNQIAARDQQQARYDQQATETIIGSIVDFSATAAKTAARNTAKQLEDQTNLAMSMDLNEIRSLAHKEGINLAERSGIQSSSLIQREDAQAGVPPHQTLNKLFGERGLGLVGQEVLYNRLYESDYNIQLNKNLQDTEQNFQLPNGRKFSGAEVENSQYAPEMLRVIQSSTRSQVNSIMRTKYGIAESHFFTDAYGKIEKQNSIRESNYQTKAQQNTQKKLTDIGDELIFDRPQTAYERYNQAGGFSLANKKFREKLAAQPDPYKREELGAVVLVDNNGKSTTWKEMFPNQFAAASVKAEEAESKRIAESQRQRQVDYNQLVITNQDNYIEAYRQNPVEAARLVRIQAREVGNGTIHPIVTQIESAQLKESTADLEQKIADGALSLSYVNSLPITLRKQGIAAYNALKEQKYGTDEKDITDGILSTARTLSDVIGDGPSSVQVFQLRTEISKVYLKNRQTLPPKEAWIKTQEEIDASRGDPNGKFFSKVTESGLNKNTFPNIQQPSKDKTERLNYVQKKMLEVGTDTVNQAFVLDDAEGMDHTYRTSQTPGQMVDFGLGIREFADKYGFTYTEVFNAHRKANNAAMGENKPLIGESPLDEVTSPDISKLIFNPYNNKTRSLRGAAQQDGTVRNRLRMSMGGSDQSFRSDSVPSGYGSVISDAASRNGIPPSILAGLIDTESGFNPSAISPVGARGLGQFMPPTAAEFGVNVNDPVSSIDGAARYLRYLTDYFNGDLEKAIYAYNGGMGNIEKFNGPIPGNQENQEYFNKVITNSNRYK